MTYVQTTRAKQSTQIFVDRLHAGEELKDLTREVERSQAKDLAHDIALPKHVVTSEIARPQQPQRLDAAEQTPHPPQQTRNPNSPYPNLGP